MFAMNRAFLSGGSVELAHDLAVEAVHDAQAAILHQAHGALLPGFKADRRAGGDVEPIAPGRLALEEQGLVGLVEVVVRSDLYRAVAAVPHLDLERLASDVERNVAAADLDRTGGVRAGRGRTNRGVH